MTTRPSTFHSTLAQRDTFTAPERIVGLRQIGIRYGRCFRGKPLGTVDFVSGLGFDLEMRPDEMRRMAAALLQAATDLDAGITHSGNKLEEFVWREGLTDSGRGRE